VIPSSRPTAREKKAMAEIEIAKEEVVKRLVDELVLHCDYNSPELQKRAIEWLSEALDAFLTEERKAAIRKAIDAEVAAVFAEGFDKFDQYGRPAGHTGIKHMILAFLTTRDSRLGGPIEKSIKENMQKAIDSEVVRLRDEIKKQVDEAIQANIVAAIKQAIGLR